MKSTTATPGATVQSVESVINDLLEDFAIEHASARVEKIIGRPQGATRRL